MPLKDNTLKCVIWNTQNFGTELLGRGGSGDFKIKARYILDYIRKYEIDIAFLMECGKDTKRYFFETLYGPQKKDTSSFPDNFQISFGGLKGTTEFYLNQSSLYHYETYVTIVRKDLKDLVSMNVLHYDGDSITDLAEKSIRDAIFMHLKKSSFPISFAVWHAPSSHKSKNFTGRKTLMGRMVEEFKSRSTEKSVRLSVWAGDFNFEEHSKRQEFSALSSILTGKGLSHRGPFIPTALTTPQPTSLRKVGTMIDGEEVSEVDRTFLNPFDQVWAKLEATSGLDACVPKFSIADMEKDGSFYELDRFLIDKIDKKLLNGLKIFLTAIADFEGTTYSYKGDARNSRLDDWKFNPKIIFPLLRGEGPTAEYGFVPDEFNKIWKLHFESVKSAFRSPSRSTISTTAKEKLIGDATEKLKEIEAYLSVTVKHLDNLELFVVAKTVVALLNKYIRDGKTLDINYKFWELVKIDNATTPLSASAHILKPLDTLVNLRAFGSGYAGYRNLISDHFPVQYTINLPVPVSSSSSSSSKDDDVKMTDRS